jgi:hypothetical protein
VFFIESVSDVATQFLSHQSDALVGDLLANAFTLLARFGVQQEYSFSDATPFPNALSSSLTTPPPFDRTSTIAEEAVTF